MSGRTKSDIAENEREWPGGVTTQAVGTVGCQRSVDHRPLVLVLVEVRLPQGRRISQEPRAA
jgi:hypothetical protein